MFLTKSGSQPVTAGIDIWSEPLFHYHNGQKVAVLLLDCQGFADKKLGQEMEAAIFSLTSLLSSVMIYNVKSKMDEDILQKVQEFSKWASVVSTTVQEKCKPHLLFLIRDFTFTQEFPFGFHDKNHTPKSTNGVNGNYFNTFFTQTDDVTSENITARKDLEKCYIKIVRSSTRHRGDSLELRQNMGRIMGKWAVSGVRNSQNKDRTIPK
ncbi:unnamed protein product [Allacma fusca]|uniref:GB1/RHD3-type G domain-containing protein n=1 Tax=Allacma fusca TaxID=39272 RepID=A0A8J2KTB9_9HEXA|nr:unnamed protein product [Allacma fusca]